jgi:NAD(P)-dependent dehydrogenase (short-subunit alcohol dehydrogenase family)
VLGVPTSPPAKDGRWAEGIGNGRAVAILLARTGARVVVADFNLANAEVTVEMIRSEGGEASAQRTDATDSDSCRQMVETVMARYGRLDILDNNVGIGSKGSVVEESEAVWEILTEVTFTFMFLTSKHAISAMC